MPIVHNIAKRKLQVPVLLGLFALMDVKHAGVVTRLAGA